MSAIISIGSTNSIASANMIPFAGMKLYVFSNPKDFNS